MDKVQVKIRAVKKGDRAGRCLGICAYVKGVIPADGIVCRMDIPGGEAVYITIDDIVTALSIREKSGRMIEIDAQSWDTFDRGTEDDEMMDEKTEQVKCTKCGAMRFFQRGVITESGKLNYQCDACSEVVLERRVAAQNDLKDGRKLLID
jgi:hypothetical protein